MQNGRIPQQQNTVAPHAPTTDIEQLYVINYASLRDAAFDEYPGILFTEVDAILGRLSRRLHRFQGTPQEFGPWAERYVRLWARHQGLYLSLVTDPEHVRVIQAAIRASLYTSTVDYAFDPDDIYGEFCIFLYSRVNGFISGPKRAKTTTRLYAMVKRHVELFHNRKHFRRINAVTERLKTGRGFNGAECFSDLELAEMRAIEQAAAATA